MGDSHYDNRPVVIARGKFTVAPNDGEQGPPGSGATITIYDQTLDKPAAATQVPQPPFARLKLSIFSSHDSAASGVVFAESQDDGANFDTTSTQTYLNANGLTTYYYLMRGGHPKITYQNSASVLTAWRYTLEGIVGDANPGS